MRVDLERTITAPLYQQTTATVAQTLRDISDVAEHMHRTLRGLDAETIRISVFVDDGFARVHASGSAFDEVSS